MKISLYCLLLMLLTACKNFDHYESTSSVYGLDNIQLKEQKRNALSGDSTASLKLGNNFFWVSQNINEAFAWYHLSAEQGNKEGMFKLADIYMRHYNDLGMAKYWYRLSIDFDGHAVNYYLGEISKRESKFSDALYFYCVSSFYGNDLVPLGDLVSLSLELGNKYQAFMWATIRQKNLNQSSVAYQEASALIKILEDEIGLDLVGKANSDVGKYYDALSSEDDAFCKKISNDEK